MTSHAAVVARGMGTPCVSGAGEIKVDARNKVMLAGGHEFAEGDDITLDGATGEVMKGEVATIQPELTGDFGELMSWVDGFRTLGVRANAETPQDARTAVEFGAEGIGLSRTEHMFFDPERIVHMREMILARDLGSPPYGHCQAAAVSAGGFHRPLPYHERTADNHSSP